MALAHPAVVLAALPVALAASLAGRIAGRVIEGPPPTD